MIAVVCPEDVEAEDLDSLGQLAESELWWPHSPALARFVRTLHAELSAGRAVVLVSGEPGR